jgi:hypothetical protein
VGRWERDCGCNTGAPAGWTQEWREPLRRGLDNLRDRLSVIFESEGGKLFADAWRARDDYIEVIQARSPDSARRFVESHSIAKPDEEAVSRAVSLLESQHNALLMYTSCGWFFNDISGIETTQLLKYAARAIELSGVEHSGDLEERLLKDLEEAISNIPENGSGADLYSKEKKYSAVDAGFIAGQFVLTRHLECPSASPEGFGYEFGAIDETAKSIGEEAVRIGLAQILSPFTLEKKLYGYFLVLGSPVRLICMLKELDDESGYYKIKANFAALPEKTGRKEIIKSAAEHFGGHVFVLSDLFPEDKEQLLGKLASRQVERISDRLEALYLESRDMLKLFSETSLQAPPSIRIPAETILSLRLEDELEKWEKTGHQAGLDGIREIFDEARYYGVNLDKSHVSSMFTSFILERLSSIAGAPDGSVTESIIEFVDYSDRIEIDIEPHQIQNVLYEILGGPIPESFSRVENLVPGSEREIAGIKSMLRLAKRFNFDTDDFDRRVPI